MEKSCNYTVRGLRKWGKGCVCEVTSASAKILVVPHTLDLILSSTYLHQFPPDFRNLRALHT